MKQIQFLFFALLLTSMAWSQAGDSKKIAGAVDAFNAAMVAGDSVALNKLTADALSYGHSSGKVEDRQTFITNVLHGPLKLLSIVATDQTIAVQKRTALVRHTFTAKASNNGTPTDLKLGVLQVWQKAHGQWKLLARQACKL